MHLSGETYPSTAASGLGIHRQVFHPDTPEPRGAAILLHGLGDHLGCHLRAAEMLCERGYLCTGVDWPGHGRSEGKRGHINGLKTVFGLIDETLAWLEDQDLPAGAPRGIYAHSTGAFGLLNHLRHRRTQPGPVPDSTLFDWIWLSSPLLRPDHGQPRLLVRVAPLLARLAPRFILDTKVRPESTRHLIDGGTAAGQEMDGCHHWVSAAFGADLVRQGRRVNETADFIHEPTRLLLTQGENDDICPPEFSRAFFDRVATAQKTYALFPGLRHELMREPGNAPALERIGAWLDQ